MAIRNWAGNVTFSATALREPTSVEQLQDLVASSPRIRALGSGHSFSPIADSSGELVSLRRVARPIVLNESTRCVTVSGASSYGEIAGSLDAAGYALHNLASLPHISVAGACATGTHGSGAGNRNLSAQVQAVEFVRADGELVRLSRAEDPVRFAGAVLSLGALGIATELTLSVEPRYEMRQDVYVEMPFEQATAHLDEVLGGAYSVSLFTDWRRPDVVDRVWLKRRASDAATPVEIEWFGASLARVPQHPITGHDPRNATPQLGSVGPWHERLPHFRLGFRPSSGAELQSEYFVSREDAAAALEVLRGIADRIAGPLLVCEIRTIAADDLWLSPANGRGSVALHFTWNDDWAAVRRALEVVESAIARFDARPHWAKKFLVQPDRIAQMYPQLPAFRELASQYDPNRVFGNAFLDMYIFGS